MSKLKCVLLFVILAAGCDSGSARNSLSESAAAGLVPDAVEAPGWMSSPADGVELRGVDGVTVSTGPHAVLWPQGAARLEPPYTVRATLHKRSGRIHEGYGLVFGGERLERQEEEQAYSYFLIRGDGSFLIRRREGTALPILRAWTTDRSIRRDADGVGQPNKLEVEVGPETTVFRVNGGEVARLPTAELRVSGVAGVRVAHDVTLEIDGFSALAGIGTGDDR